MLGRLKQFAKGPLHLSMALQLGVSVALQKLRQLGSDKRGKHHTRPLVTSASIKKQIEGHIRSFPVVKSHYSTRRRKYLSPLLSIAEMHRLYIDKYEHGADKLC